VTLPADLGFGRSELGQILPCLTVHRVPPPRPCLQLAVSMRAMPHEAAAAGLQMAAVNLAQRVA
jgi:hypothetical protein